MVDRFLADEVIIEGLAHLSTADFSIIVGADQTKGISLLVDGIAGSVGSETKKTIKL
jgi:hypothetical protein